jgi:hypothetical protein
MSTSDATTGTMLLRQAVANRNRKMHLAKWARDLDVGVGTLEDFAERSGPLPDGTKDALAKMLFGDHVSYDAERNLLRRAKTEPLSLGAAPAWSFGDNPYPPRHTPRPSPIENAPRTSKASPPARRTADPGWALD